MKVKELVRKFGTVTGGIYVGERWRSGPYVAESWKRTGWRKLTIADIESGKYAEANKTAVHIDVHDNSVYIIWM